MVTFSILQGDCIERMAEMEEASVDAVVCDPPYGIGFMGKEWDGAAIAAAAQKDRESRKNLGPESASRPGRAQPRSSSAFGNEAIIAGPVRGGIDFQHWCESWTREALRVLKPGGHLLAFGGTRTYHRLACAVEDAGFEIRDSIMWLYGSGFPKSLDVSKAIDRAAGAEREVTRAGERKVGLPGEFDTKDSSERERRDSPATPEAAQWEGWGTALKPAHEPIVVARKPPIGTVAANVLQHGTGGINVDGCRVEGEPWQAHRATGLGSVKFFTEGDTPEIDKAPHDAGRWPANVVLSHTEDCVPMGVRTLKGDQRETGNGTRPGGFANVGAEAGDGEPNAPVYGDETITAWECAPGCPVAALDAQTGILTSGSGPLRRSADKFGRNTYGDFKGTDEVLPPGDSGGASRFFYCAKTSRAERNAGLEGFAAKALNWSSGEQSPGTFQGEGTDRSSANHHPTVKPINLMRWLVRLVTPPGGTCLDPFLGSGTTGCAAVLEGFDFIGIEREADYLAIAEARIKFWAQHEGREVEDVLGLHSASEKDAKAHAERGQEVLDLGIAA